VLVIVGSRHDPGAASLVRRWQTSGAALMTCEDLSVSGWRFYVGCSGTATAVVSGGVIAVDEITGVLTRRPWVLEAELQHIAAADREYVAAEMTAFMVAWLSRLPCPVLNRPTSGCLSGPHWSSLQWRHLASRLRIPVQPPTSAAPDRVVDLTVVAGQCFGRADSALAAQAIELAAAAGVGLLGVRFGGDEAGARFLSANPWPDLSENAISDAVGVYLAAGGTRSVSEERQR
jgi:hypothetical protein